MSNLGVRNNNWLNIRYNPANDWVGQTGGDKNNYAQFDDPVNGLRAADIVLKNYGSKHGIDNLNDAIFRFAPPEDNNPTPAYARFVANKMGIAPDEKIDLDDPDTREKMIQAMVAFESPDAVALYNPALMDQARGITTATPATPATPATASATTSAPTNTISNDLVAAAVQAQQTQAPTPTTDLVASFNPNNTVRNLNSGASRADSIAFAPSGLIESFRRGVSSGAQGIAADLTYMGAAYEALTKDAEGVELSVENARILEEFSGIPMQGMQTFGEFVDNPTVGGAFEQAFSGTGQLVPSLISTITGAGLGSVAMVLGKETLKQSSRQAAKGIIKDAVTAVSRKAATPDQQDIAQAAFEAAKEAHVITRNRYLRRRSAKQGALLGAGVSEYAPLTGSNVSEALESGRDLDSTQAMRAGLVALPQAAVGVFGEVGVLKLIGQQALKKSAGPNSVMGRLAEATLGTGLKSGVLEGGAEVIQEEIAIRNRMDMDPTFTDADANLRRLNALFVGTIGGAAAGGGAAGTMQAAREVSNLGLDAAAGVVEKASEMTDTIKEFMTRNRSTADLTTATLGQTTQESDRDINAQLGAMLDSTSSKEAVWIAGTEPYKDYAKTPNKIKQIFLNGKEAFAAFVPGRGTIVSQDIEVVSNVVKGQASDAVLASALGYSSVKTGAETAVFRVYDSEGGIVSEEAVSMEPEALQAAKTAAEALMPEGGKVEFMDLEDALADRARRAGPEVRAMDEEFDPLEQEQDSNETEGDQEFEPEVRVHSFVKNGQTAQSYQAVEGDNSFDGVEEARTAYAGVLGEDVDYSLPFYKRMSKSVLNTAVKLQDANPDEIVKIAINSDGTYRIDIETTPDTQKIRIRDRRGNDEEVSMSEFIRRSLSQAAQSQQKFRTVNITPPGSDTSVSVNPVDLMNAGRRIMESMSGTFMGSGAAQSSRDGLLAMLGELQSRGYEVDIQGVPINEIMESLLNPTKELPPKIGRITVGFDDGGNRVGLEFLLRPYVPGAVTVTNLEEIVDESGNTILVSDEDAREARQDGDTLEPFEIAENNARTADGIPLTDLNIQEGERNVDTAQNRAKGSAPSTGPAKPSPQLNIKSGVTFPLGEVNKSVTTLLKRISSKLKLKVPTAVLGLKAVDGALRDTIASYMVGKTTAKGKIAMRTLRGDSKTKPLDLSDLNAVAAFINKLKEDGLFNAGMLKHIESVADATLLADSFLRRAAYDTFQPLTNSSLVSENLADYALSMLYRGAPRKGQWLGFEGASIIFINDLNNNNEAAIAMTAAHEMGHALFKEEINTTLQNKPLMKRLTGAFIRDRNQARKEGDPIRQWEEEGFEEWYADQVAAWAKKDMLGDKAAANNAVDSHFKKVVAKFKKLWAEVKTHRIFRRTDKLKPTFKKYMDDVTKARQSSKETFTSPVYNDEGDIVAWASGLGAARVAAEETSVEETTREEVADEPAASAGGSGDGGNTPPPRDIPEPNEPSWEQKAVVQAIRNEIIAQTGHQARAEQWRRKMEQWQKQFLENNPHASQILGIVRTADGMLRMVAGDEVADMFYIRSNTKSGLGFVQARQLARDEWRGGLFDVLGKDWTTDEVQNALREAQGGTPTAELQNPKAKAIREYLERLHKEYVSPSNSDIGFRENYFPVLLELSEIANDPQLFTQLIIEEEARQGIKTNRQALRRNVAALVEQQRRLDEGAKPDKGNPLDPGAVVEATIELTKNINPSVLRDTVFLQDPEVALMTYIDNITKRVEWNRATKDANGVDKLQPLLDDLGPVAKENVESVLNAYLGNVTHLSPFWRKTNSYIATMNLVTLLPFATLASLPDFAGSIVQTKEFKGFGMFMKEVVNQIQDQEAAKRLANDVGVVMPEAAANAWMSQADSDMLDPTARMATDKFFKWTGLNALTNISRQFATGMGRQFLIEHAYHPTKRSARYLEQLGVTAEQVKAWNDGGQTFTNEEGQAVRQAITRFVESSVLRPNAGERPIWASDPRFALVWQLKSFIYAFNKVILEGVLREGRTRFMEGDPLLRAMAPLLILTMAAFMPLAALGLELREYAKVGLSYALPGMDGSLKYLRSDKMDYGTYFGELFSRAGLDGPIGMLTMAQRSGDWGGSALATLLGPTAELTDKILRSGPIDGVSSRMDSPQDQAGVLLGIGAVARTVL